MDYSVVVSTFFGLRAAILPQKEEEEGGGGEEGKKKEERRKKSVQNARYTYLIVSGAHAIDISGSGAFCADLSSARSRRREKSIPLQVF